MRTALALALLAALPGCVDLFGCDESSPCRGITTNGEVGRVESALLEGATVEVCVDQLCNAETIHLSDDGNWRMPPITGVTILIGRLEDPSTSVVLFDLLPPHEEVSEPPRTYTITMTVTAADQTTLTAGTWILSSETRTGNCDSQCRSRVLYRSQP